MEDFVHKPALPPPKTFMLITRADPDDFVDMANRISENEEARQVTVCISEDELSIEFNPAPDSVIRRLIEQDVYNICPTARITWRDHNEITTECDR